MIRVLIADDQSLVRAGLRLVLESHDEVIGERRTGTRRSTARAA
jgi:DNA-binding NarL/FixJ family response regulator